MVQTYFLGANSKDGFYSLYSGFPDKKADFLHIIKGGPGTGKSSFMRRIGEAAERLGLDVEYVLCSGDPDSLDGVYIPALGSAWVDGTAPHVGEPKCFGVDADYVNIGSFLSLPFTEDEKNYVNQISNSYKALYDGAYGYLRAAAALRDAAAAQPMTDSEKAVIFKRIDNLLDKSLGHKAHGCGKCTRRFISAISCLGDFRLTDEISKLCKLSFRLAGDRGHVSAALDYAARAAAARGADIICCPSPLNPEEVEAVLIPEASLAFLSTDFAVGSAKRIRLGARSAASPELKAEQQEAAKLEKRLMTAAYKKLRQAKTLHDDMESIYKAHMDFASLTRFTNAEIKRLIK